jgi:diguanylate cyclase
MVWFSALDITEITIMLPERSADLENNARIIQATDPENRHAAKVADASGTDISIQRARQAIALIESYGMRADPCTFELWFGYVEGLMPGLNDAVDEVLSSGAAPSAAQMADLHARYMPSGRMLTEAAGLSDKLSRRAAQVSEIIESARGASVTCRKHLTLIDKGLTAEDAETVRSMIGLVKEVSAKFEHKNVELESMLQNAKKEIADLQQSLHIVRAESLTDGLTNLPNRKAFDRAMDNAIASAQGTDRPLSLLVLDVDHFKRFNDQYGHTTGDQVLRLIGGILSTDVRQGDHPARYGGEEFAVILPGASQESALAAAEKIRRAVASKELVRRGSGEVLGKVTVSIGVAQHVEGESVEAFIHRADKGLYQAKASGRNRVIAA